VQPAAHLNIVVSANTSSAVRGLQRTEQQLQRTTGRAREATGTFKTFAKGAAAGFGVAALTSGGAAAIRTFVGFDKAMRNVNSIAQLSEKRFKRLEKQVLELAGPTAQAPQTLAEGLYQLVSSGFDANEAVTILGKSARAATAGLTDTATATTAVAAVLNAYRLRASDAGKVSDSLFQTVNLGVLTFEELAQNIGDTLPFASTLKVSLNEVGAATATMTKQGLGAAETFTRIRNLLQTMIKPGTDLKRAYDELGVASGEQLIKQRGFQGALEALVSTTDGSKQAIAALFPNIRALGGAMALTGTNTRAAEKDLANMGKTSGATSRALSEQAKSASYQWQKFSAELSVFAIEVGTKVLPVMIVLVKGLIHLERATSAVISLFTGATRGTIPRLIEAILAMFNPLTRAALLARLFGKSIGDLKGVFKGMARVFGNVMAGILRGFAKLFEVASHLPVIGSKFKDLAGHANTAADRVDRLGEEVRKLPARKTLKIDVSAALRDFGTLKPPSQVLGGGKGDGPGYELEPKVDKVISRQIQDRIKKNPGAIFGDIGSFIGGSSNLMGANPILAPFAALGARYGLSVVSGLRPGAITSSGNVSYHASGHAIDVDRGSAGQMLAYAKAMASLFGNRLKELIHTPLGFGVKNGQRVPNSYFGQKVLSEHYDHVHVAMQRGGFITQGAPVGDTVPAMLERGEGVINRNAVNALGGPAAINAINSMVPRFQKGGIAGFHRGDIARKPPDIVHKGDRVGWPEGWTSFEDGSAVLVRHGRLVRKLSPAQALHKWGRQKNLGGLKDRKLEKRLSLTKVGFQKGGVAGSPLLRGLNKIFPPTNLRNRGVALKPEQVRAVAEAWGGLTPPRAYQAMQISKGESAGFHPGIVGDDAAAGYGHTFGIGLWQITRGAQGALGKSWIDSRGGDTGMRNPKNNAEVMSLLSGKGTNWGNWYGTAFLGALQPNVKSVFGSAANVVVKKKPKSHHAVLRALGDPGNISFLGPTAKQLRAQIAALARSATIAGDMADRASQLEAPVNGRDQTGWLNQQLSFLFQERNKLVDLEQLLERHRNAYMKAVADAKKRLAKMADAIRKAAATRRSLVGQVARERKRKPPNKHRLSQLQRRIKGIDRDQANRVAVRKELLGAIPGWDKKAKSLTGSRGGVLDSLDTIQGPGSPLTRLARLPAVGVLGGDIFNVQIALRDAANKVTDNSTATTDDGGQADLLRQLLQQANLRTAVSEAQFRTLRNFDATSGAPFLGAFARGGVALVGERGPELAHLPSGTRVHSADDTQRMLQPQIVVNGDIVNVPRGKQPVEVRYGRGFDRAVGRSRVNRRLEPLPGRGGGGL
jgi:TP901 family phage tail tape measure protein